jgi:hypothetical protein
MYLFAALIILLFSFPALAADLIRERSTMVGRGGTLAEAHGFGKK